MATAKTTGAAGQAAALPDESVHEFRVSSDGTAGVRLTFKSRHGDTLVQLTHADADRLAEQLATLPVLHLHDGKRLSLRPGQAARMADRLREAQGETSVELEWIFRDIDTRPLLSGTPERMKAGRA
ncbi:MAG: hypothetical protein AB9M53_03640 [Leptothrix sp. (in: b-proteobacteria)]